MPVVENQTMYSDTEKAPIINGMETLPKTKQVDPATSYLRAARSGNLEKVLQLLDGVGVDVNTTNANGLNALHLAAKDGHVDIVKCLLKRKCSVNSVTKKGNSALHIASLAGQEEVVKVLIENNASINIQSHSGFTPLYMAAQENHCSIVEFLLRHGANQLLVTEDGFSPLAVAMQQGHDKVVAILLENDTKGKVRLPALHIAAKKDDTKATNLLLQNSHNPDVTSKSGFTPLHIAAHYGNNNVATLLVQKGADVNFTAKHNITPLHVAAKWGKLSMVDLLIQLGANIIAKTRDGLTPLHCAARSGHDHVIERLLQSSAPRILKTKNGLTPLHMAAQGDHVDAAKVLLSNKAPVDDVTVDYLTSLHVAAHCGHVKVAKVLLDFNADADARALNGFTPLHIACKKNRIKVVELLLKQGASIEATTESGLTPLHVASFMGCMNIALVLVSHGAYPDASTVRGESPLHLAARANQSDLVRVLVRSGATVDSKARHSQTPLHVACRLGHTQIATLLLQHGALVDATTTDLYTPLHIASKEGYEEVASALLDNGSSVTSTTKKGFTPLHLSAKYGNINISKMLIERGAPVDFQGKNGVTPLHVASHYNHQDIVFLLLDKGASPHITAKNGYTPLHIAAKKNQFEVASTLLKNQSDVNAESKAGFSPLHLSAQEGHLQMSNLLVEYKTDVNLQSKNGLTPLHLCAQEDKVNVANLLTNNNANINAITKTGFTPLHIACHYGQLNMVRFLLEKGAKVDVQTSSGYTALHQAAQQGHAVVITLLLQSKASPNLQNSQGQTPLSIANKLGYVSVVETLKVVTETTIATTTTSMIEEKYKVIAPESMQEVFMSDSEDEGGGDDVLSVIMNDYGKPTHAQHIYLPYYQGQNVLYEDPMLSDQHQYRYMTVDDMKSMGDDSLKIDVTRDEKTDIPNEITVVNEYVMNTHASPQYSPNPSGGSIFSDNVDICRSPVNIGLHSLERSLALLGPHGKTTGMWRESFLVSFLVDARGGAMRGCRQSGVRVIIPPRKAPSPMRVTCRYLRRDKLVNPPPLMEGEALASRILELGPTGAKFLGPVIIEVPHFASMRGRERELVVLRSDNGSTWKDHTLEANEEAVQEVLNDSFAGGEELRQIEDLKTSRIERILTTDFPQYFAIVSRLRQEIHPVGPEGGVISSTVVPQVQALFPPNALTKRIKVGLQAQPIPFDLVTKLFGNRVAVSPVVTIEPRRRKFHKAITLTIPLPQATTKGMINQYSGDAPTLRLLCSMSGGQSKAQWDDVTGGTPLTFVKDCVTFTTTLSARFWLIDCRNVSQVKNIATQLFIEANYVPFMAKFVVFAKRTEAIEARLRVFCMTDDKEEKTLENQEHFVEVAKSRDVEVLQNKDIFVEFAGNLLPIYKSGEQLDFKFKAFRENRLPFTVRLRDLDDTNVARILFMREPKISRGEPAQTPLCVLNVAIPEDIVNESTKSESDLLSLDRSYNIYDNGYEPETDTIHRADIRLSDISNMLGDNWSELAIELGILQSDISIIKSEYPDNPPRQAMVMLRLWLQTFGQQATGNSLEKALRDINREDIINQCIHNIEIVTDDMEKAVAKTHLDQSGFDSLKEELGPSRDGSLGRNSSLSNKKESSHIIPENGDAEKQADKVEEELIKSFNEQIVVEKNLNNEKLFDDKYAAEVKEVIEKKDLKNINGVSKKGKKSKRNKNNFQSGNANTSKKKDENNTVQGGAD
ncbi:ankyrin-3-like isoform X3 [Daktulosphaira vitifoliae]|uniref:ankyrin-3-like isoform X3 n=1 Tax=Daktulosphaira vitifoliae TaxID=58002 RepID=UPI0021AADC7B|nr:ankyrin-3-like isoform X3 [Daktulosphaira vitifoliae]